MPTVFRTDKGSRVATVVSFEHLGKQIFDVRRKRNFPLNFGRHVVAKIRRVNYVRLRHLHGRIVARVSQCFGGIIFGVRKNFRHRVGKDFGVLAHNCHFAINMLSTRLGKFAESLFGLLRQKFGRVACTAFAKLNAHVAHVVANDAAAAISEHAQHKERNQSRAEHQYQNFSVNVEFHAPSSKNFQHFVAGVALRGSASRCANQINHFARRHLK